MRMLGFRIATLIAGGLCIGMILLPWNTRVLEKTGFREVKQAVFARIRRGEWGPGSQLPGEVDLAAEFGCSRGTVNRAMQELSDDGIIERRRKGGSRVRLAPSRQVTFEIPLIRSEIEAAGFQYRYTLLTDEICMTPEWLRVRLALGPRTRVRHLTCLHHSNGQPYQFEDRWINTKVVPRALNADFSAIGPNEWLVSEVPYTNAEVRFSAVAADTGMAQPLKTRSGEPLFMAERTTWLADAAVTLVRLCFKPGYTMVARY
jgi:GntR family transcriptional regulator, histidine utilization repressor